MLAWQTNKSKPWLRTIALLTCLIFTSQSFGWSDVAHSRPLSVSSETSAPQNASPLKNILESGLPSAIGQIKHSYQGTSAKVILHIQDAHINEEAQRNIAEILKHFGDRYGLKTVYLEGASEPLVPEIFSFFPDKKALRKVTDIFLRKGRLTGPEYLAIVDRPNLALEGIENQKLYEQNRAAYLKALDFQTHDEEILTRLGDILKSVSRFVFSPDLRNLYEEKNRFSEQGEELIRYVTFLLQTAQKLTIPLQQYSRMNALLKLVESEKHLNLEEAKKNIEALVSELKTLMPREHLARFLTQTVDYKLGKIKRSDYYAFLQREIETIFSLGAYPDNKLVIARERSDRGNLNAQGLLRSARNDERKLMTGPELRKKYDAVLQYLKYVQLYESINADLFTEMSEVEEAVKEHLFRNEDEREIARLLKIHEVLIKMFRFELTKEDAEYFYQNREAFHTKRFEQTLRGMLTRFKFSTALPEELSKIDQDLPVIEEFYRLALERDPILIENTIKRMETSGQTIGALVTGGFHTPGIEAYLEKQGYSYLVVTPNITKKIDTKAEKKLYEESLKQTPMALEEILLEQHFAPRKSSSLSDPHFQLRAESEIPPQSQVVSLLQNLASHAQASDDIFRTANEKTGIALMLIHLTTAASLFNGIKIGEIEKAAVGLRTELSGPIRTIIQPFKDATVRRTRGGDLILFEVVPGDYVPVIGLIPTNKRNEVRLHLGLQRSEARMWLEAGNQGETTFFAANAKRSNLPPLRSEVRSAKQPTPEAIRAEAFRIEEALTLTPYLDLIKKLDALLLQLNQAAEDGAGILQASLKALEKSFIANNKTLKDARLVLDKYKDWREETHTGNVHHDYRVFDTRLQEFIKEIIKAYDSLAKLESLPDIHEKRALLGRLVAAIPFDKAQRQGLAIADRKVAKNIASRTPSVAPNTNQENTKKNPAESAPLSSQQTSASNSIKESEQIPSAPITDFIPNDQPSAQPTTVKNRRHFTSLVFFKAIRGVVLTLVAVVVLPVIFPVLAPIATTVTFQFIGLILALSVGATALYHSMAPNINTANTSEQLPAPTPVTDNLAHPMNSDHQQSHWSTPLIIGAVVLLAAASIFIWTAAILSIAHALTLMAVPLGAFFIKRVITEGKETVSWEESRKNPSGDLIRSSQTFEFHLGRINFNGFDLGAKRVIGYKHAEHVQTLSINPSIREIQQRIQEQYGIPMSSIENFAGQNKITSLDQWLAIFDAMEHYNKQSYVSLISRTQKGFSGELVEIWHQPTWGQKLGASLRFGFISGPHLLAQFFYGYFMRAVGYHWVNSKKDFMGGNRSLQVLEMAMLGASKGKQENYGVTLESWKHESLVKRLTANVFEKTGLLKLVVRVKYNTGLFGSLYRALDFVLIQPLIIPTFQFIERRWKLALFGAFAGGFIAFLPISIKVNLLFGAGKWVLGTKIASWPVVGITLKAFVSAFNLASFLNTFVLSFLLTLPSFTKYHKNKMHDRRILSVENEKILPVLQSSLKILQEAELDGAQGWRARLKARKFNLLDEDVFESAVRKAIEPSTDPKPGEIIDELIVLLPHVRFRDNRSRIALKKKLLATSLTSERAGDEIYGSLIRDVVVEPAIAVIKTIFLGGLPFYFALLGTMGGMLIVGAEIAALAGDLHDPHAKGLGAYADALVSNIPVVSKIIPNDLFSHPINFVEHHAINWGQELLHGAEHSAGISISDTVFHSGAGTLERWWGAHYDQIQLAREGFGVQEAGQIQHVRQALSAQPDTAVTKQAAQLLFNDVLAKKQGFATPDGRSQAYEQINILLTNPLKALDYIRRHPGNTGGKPALQTTTPTPLPEKTTPAPNEADGLLKETLDKIKEPSALNDSKLDETLKSLKTIKDNEDKKIKELEDQLRKIKKALNPAPATNLPTRLGFGGGGGGSGPFFASAADLVGSVNRMLNGISSHLFHSTQQQVAAQGGQPPAGVNDEVRKIQEELDALKNRAKDRDAAIESLSKEKEKRDAKKAVEDAAAAELKVYTEAKVALTASFNKIRAFLSERKLQDGITELSSVRRGVESFMAAFGEKHAQEPDYIKVISSLLAADIEVLKLHFTIANASTNLTEFNGKITAALTYYDGAIEKIRTNSEVIQAKQEADAKRVALAKKASDDAKLEKRMITRKELDALGTTIDQLNTLKPEELTQQKIDEVQTALNKLDKDNELLKTVKTGLDSRLQKLTNQLADIKAKNDVIALFKPVTVVTFNTKPNLQNKNLIREAIDSDLKPGYEKLKAAEIAFNALPAALQEKEDVTALREAAHLNLATIAYTYASTNIE
ncbi:MAG: hypothetical protein EXS63_07025, partial [Candidatus Omnitrophica bacterium]|nr:hypothetical protein [Candidatus Omnitrophota bacterium]